MPEPTIPAEAVQTATRAIGINIQLRKMPSDMARAVLEAAAPPIAQQARVEERALVVAYIRDYFAAVDDGLYDDVKTLCGRIEHGNHLPAPEVFPKEADRG